MSSSPQDWNIIDFHAHIRPPWWRPAAAVGAAGDATLQRQRFRKLTSVDTLVAESNEAEVGLRLLSATVEGFFGIEGPTRIDEIRRNNDFLAEVQREHAGRLAALATIDAFSGDTGAREVERAVKELFHAGIVIDSSRDDLFLSDARARPTLEAAAALKVPVLVHPVAAQNSEALRRGAGTPGYAFGRGLVNGVAFLSLLESGLLEALPDLHLVFTALGVGSLVVAAEESEHYSAKNRAAGFKPNVYFDIMGLNPETIRYLVDFLGAERVVTGSDWPIWAPVSRQALSEAFSKAGLTPEQQELVASGNASRLLGLRNS